MTPNDFIAPHQRVPREISCAPPLWIELSVALGFAVFVSLFLWALPDFAEWLSVWGICR